MTEKTDLRDLIIQKIQETRSIPFSEFMDMALYTPEKGYYMANPKIFGATESTGDFTTSPEISPLFGQTLAQACHKILKDMPNAIILELGAGSGKLAVDLIKTLEQLGTPPEAYWILDPSLMLREKQKEKLTKELNALKNFPEWKNKLKWLDKLPEEPFCGIVIANEVLDAMPAQRFMVTENAYFETYVTYDAQKDIFEDNYELTDDPEIHRLAEYIRTNTMGAKPDSCEIPLTGAHKGNAPTEIEVTESPVKVTENSVKYIHNYYQSERIPALKPFFHDLFASLEKGAVFLIDYGFPRHEFYHPDRSMGTLMCHYQQRVHSDPYVNIGLQDITAHVDFTDVAEKATEAGFHCAGYTQQAAFLMNAGLLSLISHYPAAHVKTAMNLLTSPSEMGEIFKVMALTKNLECYPFPGFEQFDKRQSL